MEEMISEEKKEETPKKETKKAKKEVVEKETTDLNSLTVVGKRSKYRWLYFYEKSRIN